MYGWMDGWIDSVSLRYSFCGKSDGWMDGWMDSVSFEIQEGCMDGLV